MKMTTRFSAILLGLLAAPVFAQGLATDAQRDVMQQKRIESGLQSGALTTHEAARLEKERTQIKQAESKALKDGTLTRNEQHRLTQMENKASQDLYAQTHDAQRGDPRSVSSRRMQADVARDLNQERRIRNGIADGSLTRREAGRLDRGEGRVDRREAMAGQDGHINTQEQAGIRQKARNESRFIHHARLNARHRA